MLFPKQQFIHSGVVCTLVGCTQSGRFDRGLLRIVAGTPVRIFSQQVLDVACHCWSWIMSEAPEMAVDLMNMIEQSWTWMRERKLAIFSHRAPEKQCVLYRNGTWFLWVPHSLLF